MPYIWVTPETNEVNRIHYRPERLTAAQLKNGINVDAIPEPEYREDEYAVLYYTTDRGFYYEYFVHPEPEEIIEETQE